MGLSVVRTWWGRSLWDYDTQQHSSSIGLCTYQVHFAFPAILYIEHERLFQASGWVGQCEEGLVWAFCGLSVNGGENQLQ
jgi:hypothetical protein